MLLCFPIQRALLLMAVIALYMLDELCAYTPLQREGSALPSMIYPSPVRMEDRSSKLWMIKYIPVDENGALSYAERSRPFRRDVFDYEEWVRVRSIKRFADNLRTIFESVVVRQLRREVILTTAVATFICAYNALLVNGYEDFAGVHHDPLVKGFYVFSIPDVFFSLTSPVLSLFLGTCIPLLSNALSMK
jgi:hypothetical protein